MTDDKVLEIVKGWDWSYFDPDGRLHEKSRYFSDAVTKLAMAGTQNPPETLLKLLAMGQLTATGIWDWHAYRGGEHYKDEGNSLIPQARWVYALGVIEALDALPANLSYDPHVNFKEIGQGKRDKLYWNWRNNEFAIADADIFFVHGMDEYQEEWFSAREIEVSFPTPFQADYDQPFYDYDPAVLPKNTIISPELSAPIKEKNKGGRPPSYAWERAVAAIIFKWADPGSWQPESQADVVRALGEWFGTEETVPSDSLLKQRAKWLYPMFEQRKLDGQ
jgi:hypothetical protein